MFYSLIVACSFFSFVNVVSSAPFVGVDRDVRSDLILVPTPSVNGGRRQGGAVDVGDIPAGEVCSRIFIEKVVKLCVLYSVYIVRRYTF